MLMSVQRQEKQHLKASCPLLCRCGRELSGVFEGDVPFPGEGPPPSQDLQVYELILAWTLMYPRGATRAAEL